MDLESKIGTVWVCDFPFRQGESKNEELENNKFWCPGCRVDADFGYLDYGPAYFVCDAIGKRYIKLMSIAKMPGRYQDRIVYQMWYQMPCGTITKKRIRIDLSKKFSEMLNGFRDKIPVHLNGSVWKPTPCEEFFDNAGMEV